MMLCMPCLLAAPLHASPTMTVWGCLAVDPCAAWHEYLAFLSERRHVCESSRKEGGTMQATLNGQKIASSDDTVEVGGYVYFPRDTVRMDWLEKTEKTESDLQCPHGVQFYDVVIDGVRHKRNAWSYEAPQPKMAQVANRFGFWEDVQVG
jgi:uncharacterized protein (DUF427 family)